MAFLARRRPRIEIAGPFGEEGNARAVETALISALRPEFNLAKGESRWRFRPLGVPEQFAGRLDEQELDLAGFLTCQGDSPTPVLFVIITSIDFPGDRIGYDPAHPPTDNNIKRRVEGWWQLQGPRAAWIENPATSPGLLIGVFGPPRRQIVIASMRIDRDAWAAAEPTEGGKLSVPLVHPVDLDAFFLRGRKIAVSAGLKFGGIPSQFFIVLGVDGQARGGHHDRKSRARHRR